MFKRTSTAFFALLIILCVNVFAQEAKTRYLQISTNPSTVDLYTGKILPDFARQHSSPLPKVRILFSFHFSTLIMQTQL